MTTDRIPPRPEATDLAHPSAGNAAGFQAGRDDVFGRIAGRYDLLCDLFSLGIHRLWKRRMARLIAAEPWQKLLDVAAGTGDVALRVAARLPGSAAREITLADLSPRMLAIARKRAGALEPQLRFDLMNAETMDGVGDASVDQISISLALKICDRSQVFRQAVRVLRPGGRLVTLEASRIVHPVLHRFYLAYMGVCMPVIGWVATGGDASAYRYLLDGVRTFPDADGLADELRAHGFVGVTFERLSLGIVAIHIAHKPSDGETA